MTSGNRVARQVWSVVTVSLCAGVATLLVLGGVLRHARLDRERSLQHQAELVSVLSRSQEALLEGQREIVAALTQAVEPPTQATWLEKASLLTDTSRAWPDGSIDAASPRLLTEEFEALRQLRREAADWSRATNKNRQALEQVSVRCDSLLAQARAHAQQHAATGLVEAESVEAAASAPLPNTTTSTLRARSALEDTLASMEQCYRQLLQASNVEALEELRSRWAPVLAQAVAEVPVEPSPEQAPPGTDLHGILQALANELLGTAPPAGGSLWERTPTLFVARVDQVALEHRRAELRSHLGPTFARVRDGELALMLDEIGSMQSIMGRTERGFKHAWLLIVGAGSAAMICVVLVARRITASIMAQMQVLSGKNRALAKANLRVEEALASLRASEAWHDALIETTTDWVWEIDTEARFRYSSEHVERLLGYSPQEVMGKTPFEFMPTQEGQRVRRIVEERAALREPLLPLEHVMSHRDGRQIIFEATGVPVFDQDGEFRGYRGTATDVTKERRAEQDLRNNEERLRTILDAVQAGIVIVDANTHEILDANPAALRLFDAQRHEVVGRLCHHHVCPNVEGQCPITDLGQSIDRKECMVLTSAGASVPVLKTVTPINYNGRDLFVESFVDISEQKQAAEQIEFARQAAEDANQTKSEFLANMSHEIRTPMTAILGFADLLLEQDQQSEETHESVETIRRNGQHLLAIINDILDISKIEAGKMQMEAVPTSVWTIAAEVVSLMRVRAVARKIDLELSFEGPLPRLVRSDPMRLRQILLNLLGNAIKFTNEGSVRLVVREERHNSGRPMVAFDVIDTGIGIEPERLSLLFQPFTQIDSSSTRRFGGTGLGLTISRRLAKMLGGDIHVESEPNVRTRFTVLLDPGPLADAQYITSLEEAIVADTSPDETPQRTPPEPASGTLTGRVLLAEDGPDNQRLISHFLRQAGLEVEVACNGKVACEMLARAEDQGEGFDLVLMDMQMPEMDGYAATGALRERGCTLPIVALTAHAMAGDREKCLQAGCDDYATKPIDRRALIALLQEHLGRAVA
jgi:PAS domain S-box-containing protein